ncbi:hypothetical protein BH18ACI4_BH18ACI4_00930 [soil metagenome]
MKLTRAMTILMVTLILAATFLTVGAQERDVQLTRGVLNKSGKKASNGSSISIRAKRTRRHKPPITRRVIPPVTVLNNPEYLSGEASISVAANSNPLIRIGIAQNGVTLIEFPSADKFFAVHAGNSDLVTVEKSPSLKRDRHLVLRAGSGFLVPDVRAKGSLAITPATSIIAQMDSGMAITVMIYPVPLLKQQAHRLVIEYDRDEVIAARRAAGLATNLVGSETLTPSDLNQSAANPAGAPASARTDGAAPDPDPTKRRKPDYKEPVEAALSEAINNPKWFKKWAQQRHGLRISTMSPRELSESARLVLFAVRNTGNEPLRLVSGYPDLYVETLNEKKRPVEAGTKVEKFYLASSGSENLLPPGVTRYFAVAYEAPILGAQQHLKIVVAHMSAADEPAMADLTALAK